MPRVAKGSKEAIEWGKRMREARNKKKCIKGGFLQPEETPRNMQTSDAQQEVAVEGGKLKMSKVSQNINPMAHMIKNKKSRKALSASGDVTQDYLLPATVEAGKPVYYGAAGTAGMMVGGPLGAIVATEGAKELWDQKAQPYQPTQKSKSLKTASQLMGVAASSRYKQDMKTK